MARYTEAHKRAIMKYEKETLDRIVVKVPKGDKEKYKKIASDKGVSLNRLIVDYLESLV